MSNVSAGRRFWCTHAAAAASSCTSGSPATMFAATSAKRQPAATAAAAASFFQAGRRRSGADLGVRPVLVGFRLAVLHEEDDQHDEADDRYQTYQQPPTRAAGIVQPPRAGGKTRHEHRD